MPYALNLLEYFKKKEGMKLHLSANDEAKVLRRQPIVKPTNLLLTNFPLPTRSTSNSTSASATQ